MYKFVLAVWLLGSVDGVESQLTGARTRPHKSLALKIDTTTRQG